jgi:hypothetical protein
MWFDSEAEENISFAKEPAVVAEAVQKALGKVGRVIEVSRETGIIRGKVTQGLSFTSAAKVLIKIAIGQNGTDVSIQVTRSESPLVSYNGAQRALTTLLNEIGKELGPGSGAGW